MLESSYIRPVNYSKLDFIYRSHEQKEAEKQQEEKD